MRTAGAPNPDLINEFLGSTQVFASAVGDIIEEKLLRQVAPRQITFSQFKLLKMVALTDARMIGDVAAFLGVSNPAASKAVDKLVRLGLLVRSEAREDRRAIQLSLTGSSRSLLAAYEAARKQKLTKVFRHFSPRHLRLTASLLERLAAGIVDHTAHPEETCLQCGIYYREKCLMKQLVRRNCFYKRHKSRKKALSVSRGNGSR